MSPEQVVFQVLVQGLAGFQAALADHVYFGIPLLGILVLLFVLRFVVPLILSLFGYELGDDD